MYTITSVVQQLIEQDEIALEAMRSSILNFSAYADNILPEVERIAHKAVKRGSVVVALHRISQTIDAVAPLRPDVKILDISIKSPLCEVTFDRTAFTLNKVAKLPEELLKEEFFTITEGLREISIICSQQVKLQVLDHFAVPSKGTYENLVSVTLRFDEQQYIEQPNMIFTLVSALAGKRINIIEIVSTFTEISFIVKKEEMDSTIGTLQQFFYSGK